MKKLLIGFALVCFVAFGTFSVQASTAQDITVETVKMKLDDNTSMDITPDGKDKKDKDKKDKKGECKDTSAKGCETAKSSCCSSKSAAKCDDKKEAPKKEGDDKK